VGHSQAEQIANSPVGAVVLALLELGEREDAVSYFDWDGNCDPAAVESAICRASKLGYEYLLADILQVISITSPFNPDSGDEVTMMCSHASERLQIAEHLVNRFADRLTLNCQVSQQEVWLHSTHFDKYNQSEYFEEYQHIYDQGQFTWAGMRSITSTYPEITDWILKMGATIYGLDMVGPIHYCVWYGPDVSIPAVPR